MSDPIDDKLLTEYLKGRSDISQRYRELGGDEVPSRLDQRVLDQAHSAAARRPPARSRLWMRWSAPVALAASAVLVLSIMIEGGVQHGLVAVSPEAPAQRSARTEEKRESSVPQSAPAEIAAAKSALPEQPASDSAVAPAPAVDKIEADREQTEVTASAQRAKSEQILQSPIAGLEDRAFAVAPPPAAPVAPPRTVESSPAIDSAPPPGASGAAQPSYDLSEVTVTGAQVRNEPERRVGPRGTIAEGRLRRAAEPEKESQAQEQAYSEPERWLEDIRKLRKDGRSPEADAEWVRFREAYPDYAVAESDLAKPED
ncbi:MAG: hypothetical protein ACREV5_11575 [Steroidobacter sp.]